MTLHKNQEIITIAVEGGIVQWITTDNENSPVKVVVLDMDVDETVVPDEDDGVVEVVGTDGDSFSASMRIEEPEFNPSFYSDNEKIFSHLD